MQCSECGKEFGQRLYIGNKIKLCQSRKRCFDCSPYDAHDLSGKSSDRENTNKKSVHVVAWRQRVKLKLVEYKGGKCERCGYNKPFITVYNFHHKDPSQKEFQISGTSRSFESLKAEVDKCKLLCRNCHGEIHEIEIMERRKREINEVRVTAAQLGAHKMRKLKERSQAIDESRITQKTITCKHCGEQFETKLDLVYCSNKCSSLSKRRAIRPPLKDLLVMVEQHGYSATARYFRVSDNAVRKWIKHYRKQESSEENK